MGDENVFSQMDLDLLHRIDILRECIGEPLIITSSYRTQEYNNEIGGSRKSMHLQGRAVDFYCNDGALRLKIVESAIKLGMSVGVARNFVHVDNRENQIVFTY